jgi:tRNA(Ile)-lysidine synthetase-like protein
MRGAITIRTELRRDPTVRAIARSWRGMTGGLARGRDESRRTLLACSGGADSCGTALALWAAVSEPRSRFILAHIVHDLRPREAALADLASVRELGECLGIEVISAEVQARGRSVKNLEASARQERYRTLASIARDRSIRFVATAHHADDQLESVLMALVRGAGPAGLAGVAESRRLSDGVRLIRPALGATRVDLRRICAIAEWAWREDATNADVSRVRARIRSEIAPRLEAIRPGVARRAARSANLARGAARVVREAARTLMDRAGTHDGTMWTFARSELRRAEPIVLGEVLRLVSMNLRGERGRDRLGNRGIEAWVDAIRAHDTDPKRISIGGIRITITAQHVRLSRSALRSQDRTSDRRQAVTKEIGE